MFLLRLIPSLLLIGAVFGLVKVLYMVRAKAMRSLAARWGLRYLAGEPQMLRLSKKLHPMPTSFRLKGYPVDTLNRTWNLIDGQIGGVQILILDSTLSMGGGTGRYTTFIAARKDKSPFELISNDEVIVSSNGWTAIYKLRFWQIPWTLSTKRIDQHLRALT